ncbi:MAG: aminopeptidase P family protein [Albidovulum sp.]|nr:aminopeptidase P family protein [Albidovulum sp.]
MQKAACQVRFESATPYSVLQDFDNRSIPRQGPPRLARLREKMSAIGLAGYLIPRADAYGGEWVAPCDRRLEWLTGFTGTAGLCIALEKRAAIFVDARYRIQAGLQVDRRAFETRGIDRLNAPRRKAVSTWLAENLEKGSVVGYDSWLHTRKEIGDLRSDLECGGLELKAVANLVDKIWMDRPPPPLGRVEPYPIEYSGETHESKRIRIANSALGGKSKAVLVASPESIAWLLNIRGSDIQRTPVAHAFAILNKDASVELFALPEKFCESARRHLEPNVCIRHPDALAGFLSSMSGPVLANESTLPDWIANRLYAAGVDIEFGDDPCEAPKATRNSVEVKGAAEAHLRDGAAMAEFLAWTHLNASKGITEIDAVRQLEKCRIETGALRDISFETIAASGPNGAIVHYNVTKQSNRKIRSGETLLVDSGGQYLDGTTDVTRTIGIGNVDPEIRMIYTLVVKGLIAVSQCRWPSGKTGIELDAFARYHLWMAGLDYGHSTGHGVGHFLGVHEGPQYLGPNSRAPIRPGMILSIEPGYYRDFKFGVRTENLAIVKKFTGASKKGDQEMLCFRTLTRVPIDISLLDLTRLNECERKWLNEYHASVLEDVAPRCSAMAKSWLKSACAPI